jgi:hypothetical protein
MNIKDTTKGSVSGGLMLSVGMGVLGRGGSWVGMHAMVLLGNKL